MKRHWIDRVTAPIAPLWTLRRQRARLASELLARHYEAASVGRRTQGWRRAATDANAAIGPGLALLRQSARDLIRNNPHAESAINTICDHTIGWGIVGKHQDAKIQEAWRAWSESTDCDADGQNDFAGLQELVLQSVISDGEVLVRRRIRRPEDDFRVPLQLQVLEADYLDTSKDNSVLGPGGTIVRQTIQGVEFDAIGRRTAYWLFDEHPGSNHARGVRSSRIPAESIQHIFLKRRAGQVRAASWFAPVLLRFKDFDDYEDAVLMKAKIAACLAVLTTDLDGTAPALGTEDDTVEPGLDNLEPGMIMNVPPGRSIEVVQPPQNRDYKDHSEITLRSIATGLNVTYEDLTGDYTDLPFSAARMSRLRHWSRVEKWRWRLMIPQFCMPTWEWFSLIATVNGVIRATDAPLKWTAPPMPMIEPDKEGLAYQRNIRTGIMTLSEAIRERGYDPEEMLAEIAEDNATLDRLKIVLDSDPRKMTQAGQAQSPLTDAARATDAAASRKAFELVSGGHP